MYRRYIPNTVPYILNTVPYIENIGKYIRYDEYKIYNLYTLMGAFY